MGSPPVKYLIPNLLGGVSQQEPSLRDVSQLDAMVNMVASPVYGLCDRPPTTILQNLSTYLNYSAAEIAKTLFRSVEYKNCLYHLIFLPSPYNLMLMFDANGVFLSQTALPTYLQTTDPNTNLAVVEMGEAILVINKTIPVQATSPIGIYPTTQKRYIYVKGVAASAVYQVSGVDSFGTEYGPINVLADATPDSGSLAEVAASIAAAINNPSGAWYNKWIAVASSTITGLVEIYRIASRSDLSNITTDNDVLTVSDSTGGTLISAINRSVSVVDDLPPRLPTGMQQAVGIKGVGTKIAYYMGWTNVKDGWVETTADGGKIQADPTTFPYLIRPTGSGDKIVPITATLRRVGDTNSAPLPSFVGNRILDLSLFQNRIAILTDHSVSLSVPDAFTTDKSLMLSSPTLDFASDTATAVMDDDPIDIQIGDAGLHHMAPLDTRLLLVGKKCVKSVGYNDFLSPKDVHLEHHFSTPSSADCNPLDVEGNILFTHSQQATQIKELVAVPDTTKLAISYRTRHLPTYLTAGITRLIGYSPANTVFAFGRTTPSRLYVCAYLMDAQHKVIQNAWGYWDFGGTVLEVKVLDGVMYLLVADSTLGVELLSLDLSALEATQLLLDRKTVYPSGSAAVTYDSTTDATSVTVTGPVEVVVVDGREQAFTTSSGVITLTGDQRAKEIVTGVRFTRSFTLSPQVPRDEQGQVLTTTHPMRFMLTRLEFSHHDGHHFTVKVSSPRGERVTVFGPPLDQSLDIANRAALMPRGRVSMTLMGDAVRTTISVENDTIHPCKFTEVEVEGRISRL